VLRTRAQTQKARSDETAGHLNNITLSGREKDDVVMSLSCVDDAVNVLDRFVSLSLSCLECSMPHDLCTCWRREER
jgi:hypothetical protein